jgi:hypothetical protein
MISIDKLVQTLSQSKDNSIKLGSWNDNSKYLQATAIDIRKKELENLDMVFENINPFQYVNNAGTGNYTMDSDLQDNNISINNINNNSNNSNNNSNKNNHNNNINNSTKNNKLDVMNKVENKKLFLNNEIVSGSSIITYNENEVAALPEIIIDMLNKLDYTINEWYIYGIKNPESFYKSFLLLTKMDFIIKNKNDKKNDVITFKREMALHYEHYYKLFNYRKLRFPKFEMIHNLINMENYCNYDAIKYTIDYSQHNILILDIINMQYLDINYILNPSSNPSSNESGNESCNTDSNFSIIIKYTNNTYLPLMNSDGKHTHSPETFKYIQNHFERIQITKFKEYHDINQNDNNGDCNDVDCNDDTFYESTLNENDTENTLENNIIDDNSNSDILEDDNNTIADYGISTGDESSIKMYNKLVNDTIINKQKININEYAIEDMIEIEEQETTPLKNNNIIQQNNNKSQFDLLMDIIPIKTPKPVKTTKQTKQPKTQKINTKIIANDNDDNDKDNNTIKLEELLNTVEISSIEKSNLELIKNTQNVNNVDNVENITKIQLKLVNKYTLTELQDIAKQYKIDICKNGKSGKKINKTKDEIYNELINNN